MFDYSYAHWLSFLSAAFLLSIAPGPDLAFILGNVVKDGRKSGYAAMCGILLGVTGHVVLAVVGLSAIIVQSAFLFSVVKWLGALYLIYLGVKMLFSGDSSEQTKPLNIGQLGWKSTLSKGFWICILNPKVGLFFLAFLPLFVEPGAGPVSLQILLHGLVFVLIAAIVEPVLIEIVLLAIQRTSSKGSQLAKWVDRVIGSMFIALGGRLAWSEID